MKSKTTPFWFLLAVALAATIWLLNHYARPSDQEENRLCVGLKADHITSLQIFPAGAREISVVRTNNVWWLDKPLVYPAQAAAVDGLLGALEKLPPVFTFSAGDMSQRKNADAEFGFDHPQFTLDVTAGDQTWHLCVGNRTAPGDGVYVRVVGKAGAYVTDTSWLQFLKDNPTDWRDTSLVNVPDVLDWLVVSNGAQAIELRRDVTNRLWRMIRPLAARANNLRIATAVQQLRTARVTRFVSDDPKADLASFGLEPAALNVWLGAGTNLVTGVHAGKDSSSGAPGEIYARRDGLNAIVSTPKESVAPWHGSVNDFRDPNLLELSAPVAEIEMRGKYNFILQQHASNTWSIVGEKFSVEADTVARLVNTVARLQITDFVQDVVTPSGLQNFGLATPVRQLALRGAVGNTNSTLVQLLFGDTSTNETFVKRGDEDCVYAVAPAGLAELTLPGDYYRDHRIWNFSETAVAQVTLRQNGKLRQMIRTGTNAWSLADGSQGIINPPAIEETVHGMSQLFAQAWIGRDFNADEVGVSTNSLSVTIELKSGEKHTVEFGNEVRVSQNTSTALAVVTLEGERWAFVFPTALCQLVAEYLTIPASAP